MTTFNSSLIIMSAMKMEAQPIIDKLGLQKENTDKLGISSELPLEVYQGIINNKKVFLVYNGKDSRYQVDRVGLQRAVQVATMVVEKLKPHLIISAGTAGGFEDSKSGDVIISGETFAVCDTWISVPGYEEYSKGYFPYYPLSDTIIGQLGLKKGRIVTSNSFDLTERDIQELKRLKASAVDMEVAGISGVCEDYGVGIVGLKVITNPINDKEAFECNYNSAVKILAEKTAILVKKLLESDLPTSSYYILDETNLCAYLKRISNPFLQKFSDPNKTKIENVGDGNLNNVFRITHVDTQESLILKQALPYAKILGENALLSSQRMLYEIHYFDHVHRIVPVYIPKIYYADKEEMMVLCMQDLNTHQVLREGLLLGKEYPKLAEHLSTFLAQTLLKTSKFYLSTEDFETLSKKFQGNALCQLTNEYIFTRPFKQDSSNHLGFQQFSSLFLRNAFALRHLFNSKREALIHGDLHTGSLMVNEQETFIIDSEFAFMGPMSFDIGILLANLITAWVAPHQKHYKAWLLETIKNFYTLFSEKFSELWKYDSNDILSFDAFTDYKIKYLQTLFSEAVGFAGLEICRRICGIAGVKEIRNIQDPIQKIATEQLGLAIGCSLVENYSSIQSIENVLELMKLHS